jgi:hypothetical protein
MTVYVHVSWPAAPLTASLVQGALKKSTIPISYVSSAQTDDYPLLQWSTYDEIDHERVHLNHGTVLSSSYIFRKALIRKHYLSRAIRSFLTKHPSSVLSNATPRTYEIEISFADELDEMWTDDLWDLGSELSSENSWWILKPSAFWFKFTFSFLNPSFLVEWPIEVWESDSFIAKKICEKSSNHLKRIPMDLMVMSGTTTMQQTL